MNLQAIYALDFDGVICDSAVETAVSGWKAGQQLWSDYPEGLPSDHLIHQFRQVRPVMATGYEAILILRLLFNGNAVEKIIAHYAQLTQQLISDEHFTVEQLKTRFAAVRDHWIANNLNEWLTMNPLFPGIADKLRMLSKQGEWFIITTKQERFVQQILKVNHIELPEESIYGLDRRLSKTEILANLIAQYPEHHFYFVEDMLPTLLKVKQQLDNQTLTLQLADWGYNTPEQRQQAVDTGIICLNINEFLSTESLT